MMIIVDGRGKNKKALGAENRARVKKWFEENPGSSIADCCRGIKSTYKTVKGHIVAIQAAKE